MLELERMMLMSIRNYYNEAEIEDIAFMIEDIKKIVNRLKTLEQDLLDLQDGKKRKLAIERGTEES